MGNNGKMQGVVKWFNNNRGFGFIGVKGHPDVFVHYSKIVASGYRSLNEGDRVEFSLEHDDAKGRDQAVKVVCLPKDDGGE